MWATFHRDWHTNNLGRKTNELVSYGSRRSDSKLLSGGHSAIPGFGLVLLPTWQNYALKQNSVVRFGLLWFGWVWFRLSSPRLMMVDIRQWHFVPSSASAVQCWQVACLNQLPLALTTSQLPQPQASCLNQFSVALISCQLPWSVATCLDQLPVASTTSHLLTNFFRPSVIENSLGI